MNIKLDFIPDIIEIYDFEKGIGKRWGKQPERSKREDLNILILDSEGKILKKQVNSRCGALNSMET